MSNHKNAIVPIGVWTYQSPELFLGSQPINVGLFAEALLCYDEILLNVESPGQFSALIEWFLRYSDLQTFLSLFEDGIVKICEYSFISTAIEKGGIHTIWNVEDQTQQEPNTFFKRYLYSAQIDSLIPKARKRIKLYKALSGKVIEEKAKDFGPAIENARADSLNSDRNTIILQSFLDYYYDVKKLGKPPLFS